MRDSDRGRTRMTFPGQGKGGGEGGERMVVVVGRGCIHVERALRERGFIANNCAATLFAFYRIEIRGRYRAGRWCVPRDRDLSFGSRANINLNGFSTPLLSSWNGVRVSTRNESASFASRKPSPPRFLLVCTGVQCANNGE